MAQVTDKELHFFAGVVVSFAAAILLNIVDVYLNIPLLPLWVLLVTAAAASYREMQGVKWDWNDWIHTIAGGLVGVLVSFV
jgi:ABC-type antimicrobial peptide transport system permease subunit